MVFSATLFFFALFGIGSLFGLKRWEETRGYTFAPRLRRQIDYLAQRLSELVEAGQKDIEKLPRALVHMLRLLLHLTAVGFGHLAHWVGEQSHKLADLVSYKHRFERRELRSEFLKKVIRHKNGHRLDDEGPSGQNG